ncbi:metallophosphoesterase family protein [Agrobacterium tumefaciens]|uniref:metallophosphoesterase family protein n=1 Tax=Agrobacterium tumefaciens TaxID=358 RepID=UPI0022448DC0|nr:metallophosphoesterase family protein [Agrobacterium tumefaciens]MCW8060714.1 metallophosphoesterase family protein [Agrobacterium tumefaciens]
MIFFTSDTHFADPRVLRIDRRPFPNMAEHDAALIQTWNDVIGEDDDVWHLGDFMSVRGGDCDDLLVRLHGRKHLIVGNNDPETTTSASHWTSVQHYRELEVDGLHLILCHYAFRTWNKMGKKSINLHGHSHGKLKPLPRQFDVGVDAQRLRPVTLAQIISKQGRAQASVPH